MSGTRLILRKKGFWKWNEIDFEEGLWKWKELEIGKGMAISFQIARRTEMDRGPTRMHCVNINVMEYDVNE